MGSYDRKEEAKIMKLQRYMVKTSGNEFGIFDWNTDEGRSEAINKLVSMGYSHELILEALKRKETTKEDIENEEVLSDPNLFNKIVVEEFDKKIVGEIPARKVIFLCACGRLVENHQIASYNLLVNSSAGAGKDYVVSKILDILPKDNYIRKTRISPTVFTYWHNSQFEPEWTWDGKVFYTEDISENILNHEVFKVMTSSGSEATIVVKQRAIEINIKGKPVVITTTATAVPNPELTRRFEFCNLDEGIDQTKAIMERHSKFASQGINPEYDERFAKAMESLKRVKVKVPYAEKIHDYFPQNNIIMRTKYPRFLDLIKASTAFHQFMRKKDEEGYYLAEGQDYEIAKEVIEKLSSNRYMIPLTLNQQKIMKWFEENPGDRYYAQQCLNKMGNIMALKNFQRNLGLLVHHGLLEKEIERDAFNKDTEYYKLPNHFKNSSETFKLPSYKELIK